FLDVLHDLIVVQLDSVVDLPNLSGLIDEIKLGAVDDLIRFGFQLDIGFEGFPRRLLDLLEGIAREEMPVGEIHVVLLGELVDRLLIVPLRIDAEGNDLHIQPFKFQPLLEERHVGRHRGTDGVAIGEDEIGEPPLALQIGQLEGLSVLVHRIELRYLPRDLRFAFRVLTGGGGTSAGETIGDVQRLPYENSREETDSTEPCDPLQLFAAVFHRMPLPSLIAKDPGGSDVPSFLAGLEMFRPALSYDITQREGTGRK